MVLISYLCFAIAVALYAISQLQMHGKLIWSRRDDDYWGRDSGRRKYKKGPSYTLLIAPDKLYYRLFKIKYVEKFPFSATALSFLTDGYHMFQFIASKLVIISILTFSSPFSWLHAIGLLSTWYVVFGITYIKFSR